MCRNIKTLFNFDPPATDEEIQAAALQFVRKLSGFNRPSKANEAAFNQAVQEFSFVARQLLDSLVTQPNPAIERSRSLGPRHEPLNDSGIPKELGSVRNN